MNKKHICLFATLFLISTFISATMVVAFADSQQSTTVTYTSLSPEEKNNYTINIPSNVSMTEGEDSKTINIPMSKAYDLEDTYVVSVDVDKQSITASPSPANQQSYAFRLFLNDNNSYYRTYSMYNSNNERLYYFGSDTNLNVATFHADASQNTGGSLTLIYDAANSTDKNYKEAGTYTGTLTFNITGSYE